MSTTQEAALAATLLEFAHTPEQRTEIALSLAEKLSSPAGGEAAFPTALLLLELLRQVETTPGESTLSTVTSDEVQHALQSFVLASFQQSNITDLSRFNAIIKLCSRDTKLAEFLIANCSQELGVAVSPFSTTSDGFAKSLDPIVKRNGDSKDHTIVNILQCLTFLKVLAWEGSLTSFISMTADSILCSLVGAESEVLASASLDALLALINSRNKRAESSNMIQSHELHDIAWRSIRQLTSDSTEIQRSTRGYSLWSALMTPVDSFFPNSAILACQEYWSTLQSGLAYGTAQYRKSCLFILKMSLARLDHDVDCLSMTVRASALDVVRSDYTRYITLFETIVLDRYLNQVQDCLKDLALISSHGSHVGASWIIALVHAALTQGMLDSIRKLIGVWVMDNSIEVLQQELTNAPEFLEKRLLPWASLGYHFTSSIQYANNRTPVSIHGEKVSSFISRLLVSEMESYTRANIIKAILSFLLSKTGRIYQFARAFILDGIVQACSKVHHKFDRETVSLVLQVSTVVGFTELVRDLMILQCGQLVGHASPDVRQTQDVERLLQKCSLLKQKQEYEEDYANACLHFLSVHASLAVNTGEESEHLEGPRSQVVSLTMLHDYIEQSHVQYLGGQGLKAACICVLHAIDKELAHEIVVEELQTVLYAIWDEVEIQEYPKQIVMRIPRIFFHPKCVALCVDSQLLKSTLSDVALQLQRLADHRVYVFSPLTAALRRVCLSRPEAVELPLADLFSRFANNPPVPKEDFFLENALSSRLQAFAPQRSYSAYYGHKEAYGHACVYDCLNRMPQNGLWVDVRVETINKILEMWISQKEPVPISSHWKNSAQLQTVLILLDGLIQHVADNTLDYYLKTLQRLLSIEPLPRLRHLLEWIVARIYMQKPSRRRTILQSLNELDLSVPKHVVSMQRIALALARLPNSDEAFALELATELIPLAASPKVIIRHEGQWTFPALYAHCEQQGWTSITENVAFSRLNSFITNLEVYKTPPAARLLENLDLRVDHTLTCIFQGLYLRIEPVEKQKVLREDFLNVYADDEQHGYAFANPENDVGIPLGKPLQDSETTAQHINTSLKFVTDSVIPGQVTAPLQTKASTWEDGLTGPSESQVNGGGRRSRDLIVVCSLINNAYNLGGLSRVGEIFGIKSLQVADLAVVKNKDFTAVSVSSHLWLPIEQLEVDAVPDFLVQRKLEGYTVVGIEQTDSSKVLGQDNWHFPKKTVLVLGSEREGISARLLPEMDICVEIKQVGVTRSMNVQTAAAAVLYEYSRQYP